MQWHALILGRRNLLMYAESASQSLVVIELAAVLVSERVTHLGSSRDNVSE